MTHVLKCLGVAAMSTSNNSSSERDREELIRTELVVLVGEFLVAAGSIIVVIGLLRAFKMITKK
jgi:hypothetical protein